MLKLVVTVKIDLSSCHGNDIPCSVSFYDDYLVSTVSALCACARACVCVCVLLCAV